MRTKRFVTWSLVIAAATVGVAAVPGCELLVDFDRSKIPQEGGLTDVTTSDSPAGDSSPGNDVTVDSPGDTSAADAPGDTSSTEGGPDAPNDVHETSTGDANEAGPEAAVEAEAGAPQFTVGPAAEAYGTVAIGTTTADVTYTITNTGTASGTPTVAVAGTNSGDFLVGTNGCTSAVAPNGTCTVTVHFKPTASGARAATLGATPPAGSAAALTGTGATAGLLTISPVTKDYGTVTHGSSSTDFSFTVTNGDAVNAVTLTGPVLDGQDAAQFAYDGDAGTGQCGTTLAASGACVLNVHFAPAAAGTDYASLSISGGASNNASASLTGTAN